MLRHRDFVDVGSAPSLRAFERRLVGLAASLHFEHVSAVLVTERVGDQPQFVAVGNTPPAYLAASRNAEKSRRDPVMRRLKRSSLPFVYDERTYREAGATDLWEEQAAFGLRTGVAVALHLPEDRHFLLGVDRAAPLPADEVALTALMAQLQLLAVHAQDAAQRLLTARPDAAAVKLTRREAQVLRLTMQGCTAAEIARLLRVSEATVQFHLANARNKFGATSKHQAVLRAIQLGLL